MLLLGYKLTLVSNTVFIPHHQHHLFQLHVIEDLEMCVFWVIIVKQFTPYDFAVWNDSLEINFKNNPIDGK